MLALSLDNLLFFLLIAVAALFQLLSKAMSKAGKSDSNETSRAQRPQTARPIQGAPRESDADRIRKFLEALGQPPSSTPPPLVLPRADIPRRPLAPVQPPPVIIPGALRLPRERRRKRDITREESHPLEQPNRLEQTVPSPVPPLAASAFEVHEELPEELQARPGIKAPVEAYAATTRPHAKPANFKTQIATSIVSRSGLQEAILLREILGPPRGLQAFDFL